ncbi:OmpA family protein [Devosia sp. WQ 349]|uniref:OmpA family protein n=1 Tax=Devosia sp. WQ 349K1 TaxID=2800329 RepID=UPI001904FEA4|nr:OmpA family protein [Devosia sp. WQ 349K1]
MSTVHGQAGTATTPSGAAETATPSPTTLVSAPGSFSFVAVKVPGGALSFRGQVPSEATLRYLSNLSGVVVDRLAVSGNAPDDFGAKLQSGMRSLMELDQGRLELRDGDWTLTGEVGSDDVAQRLGTELGGDSAVSVTVTMSRDECVARLAELSAHNAILFRSGSSVIAESASAELDLFAQALKGCGHAAVEVEGHTDSDGDDQKNLILSVMRAEAVVKALVGRGIAEERFYAIGYGETVPVAANDTQAGKSANRRIVIRLRD